MQLPKNLEINEVIFENIQIHRSMIKLQLSLKIFPNKTVLRLFFIIMRLVSYMRSIMSLRKSGVASYFHY